MFRKSAFLAAIAALAIGATARADVETSSVTFEAQAPGFPAPQMNIDQWGATQGQIFTNQFSGVPFMTGGEVRTVGAFIVPTVHVHNDGTISGIASSNNAGNVLVYIFGIKGNITQGLPMTPQALFNMGAYKVVELPNGAFNAFHPGTWGFTNPAYMGTTALLRAPDNIITGPNGFPVGMIPSSQVNLSAAQPAINGIGDGTFLFDNGGNLAHPADAIFLLTQQQTQGTTDFGFTAADMAALNAIANFAFGGNFANFGSGQPTDFIPGFAGGVNTTGDFGATLLLTVQPSQTAPPPPTVEIPEIDPGSMLSALTMLGAGMLILSDKWRRKK
jgi:hypothetical protein